MVQARGKVAHGAVVSRGVGLGSCVCVCVFFSGGPVAGSCHRRAFGGTHVYVAAEASVHEMWRREMGRAIWIYAKNGFSSRPILNLYTVSVLRCVSVLLW